MKKDNSLLIFLLVLISIWGCGGEPGSKNDSNLPTASSVANEILIVMDSAKWKGELGEKIREVFESPIPGLPQEEKTFTLQYISPRYFKGFYKLYPNILFATILNDSSRDSRLLRSYFTANSLEQMRKNPEMFMYPLKNEFARGQEVLHLFAPTEEQLIEKLEANERRLTAYFLEFERNRLSRRLFSGLPNKNLSEYIEKKYGFRMEFPPGYKVAKERENFIWVRLLDNDVDRSIWVGYVPYRNEDVFSAENILDLRERLAKPSIWGSDSTTFMKTETLIPVQTREINFKGRYAIEARGLWRLNRMTMGGPFLSYTFVDEATNRLYYIEGFTYAPGENKREPMRELEAILWTFKTSQAQATESPTAAENTSSN